MRLGTVRRRKYSRNMTHDVAKAFRKHFSRKATPVLECVCDVDPELTTRKPVCVDLDLGRPDSQNLTGGHDDKMGQGNPAVPYEILRALRLKAEGLLNARVWGYAQELRVRSCSEGIEALDRWF